MKFLKKILLYSFLALILYSVVGNILFFIDPSPFKVTDPNESGFDITEFEFNDYNYKDFKPTTDILFPVGTHQDDINNVLINVGGASYKYTPQTKLHSYTKESWKSLVTAPSKYLNAVGCGDYTVHFCLDSDQRVISSTSWPTCPKAIIGLHCPKP
jgi:hypothetical protein